MDFLPSKIKDLHTTPQKSLQCTQSCPSAGFYFPLILSSGCASEALHPAFALAPALKFNEQSGHKPVCTVCFFLVFF